MKKTTEQTTLMLPALRGTFGSWVFYCSLMSAPDMKARISFAREIHANKQLSDWIQRKLEGSRAKKIREYLKTKERFFNSLVLAVYGGQPKWIEIGSVRSQADPKVAKEIETQGAANVVGFLRLTGREKMFALDGQHRLAGIKQAVEASVDLDSDTIPVVFVGHENTPEGMRRTRRLFTTLNKTAVPVNKGEIIALDEDDVMAITVRKLFEEVPTEFAEPKIKLSGGRNLPPSNVESLTTIGNLYDCLKVLFKRTTGKTNDQLRFNRPPDDFLQERFIEAKEYFSALRRAFRPLDEYFKSKNPMKVIAKYRSANGGHLLFRPIGLEVVTSVIAVHMANGASSIEAAVRKLKGIPVEIAEAPFEGVLWDPSTQRMITKDKKLAIDLLLWTTGFCDDEEKLLKRYRKQINDKTASLPD